MKTLVVYESLWGNTAAVARAIAEGAGPEAKALTTDEATPDVIAEAELIVAGAPVIAFGLPSERMLGSLATSQRGRPDTTGSVAPVDAVVAGRLAARSGSGCRIRHASALVAARGQRRRSWTASSEPATSRVARPRSSSSRASTVRCATANSSALARGARSSRPALTSSAQPA